MKILYTDRAWDDSLIETELLREAGHELIDARLNGASASQIVAVVREHQPDALLVCFASITAEVLDASPRLRAVSRMGVGLDNVAVDYARERGVQVMNVADYCVDEVATHALALTLALRRHIVPLNAAMSAGHWDPTAARFRRLGGSTMGIIGCGKIGSLTARKAAGIGMHVIGYDPHVQSHEAMPLTDLDSLIAQSDVISLHVPLNGSTRHLVDQQFLARMRPGALIVNTSRGPLIDNDALVRALDDGRIGGAGLDTLEGEPAIPAALRGRHNVILTPHVAFASRESLQDLRRMATENLLRVLSG